MNFGHFNHQHQRLPYTSTTFTFSLRLIDEDLSGLSISCWVLGYGSLLDASGIGFLLKKEFQRPEDSR